MHYQRVRKNGSTTPISKGRKRPGDVVTYNTIHRRLYAERGPANWHDCAHCPDNMADEWAYTHADPDELYSQPGEGTVREGTPYSLNLDCYVPLCYTCHKQLDNGQRKTAESVS